MSELILAIADLPEREQILILRASCHVANETHLPEALRFGNRVTELDAARLIHGIERGSVVVQRNDAWADLGGNLRARMPHLTRIVSECLRLGLVTRVSKQIAPDVRRISLAVAPVHRSAGANRPWCRSDYGVVRFRLADDPSLVDCETCLAAHG